MAVPLRRWNLKSADNMRDLGGYACEGGATKYGKLLRSDHMAKITEEEKDFLIRKGLTDIIDLRSKAENAEFPNPFADCPKVKLHDFSAPMDIGSLSDFNCMGESYIKRFDCYQSYYVDIIDAIINSSGMVIFHCTAGKDRTGSVAALILLSLGVDERDVIADYEVSHTFLKHQAAKVMDQYSHFPAHTWRSDPSNMEMTVAHLDDKYGGALGYLKSRGFSDTQYAKLRECMVEWE